MEKINQKISEFKEEIRAFRKFVIEHKTLVISITIVKYIIVFGIGYAMGGE